MSAIEIGAASCLQSFQQLLHFLRLSDLRFRQLLPAEKLRDEHGRFKVWCGNLGALQKGHSSLDWRLRDSQLIQSEVQELLKELLTELRECIAVVSGARPPYEDSNPFSQDTDKDGENDSESSSSVSSDGEESDEGAAVMPKTELQRRLSSICDVMGNLYKLSIQIRKPSHRERSLRALAYQEIDAETRIDLFAQYAISDRLYTEEVFRQLRSDSGRPSPENDFLLDRLSFAITQRRRRFKYWRRHRYKLTGTLDNSAQKEIASPWDQAAASKAVLPEMSLQDQIDPTPEDTAPRRAPATIISGTDATAYVQKAEEILETQTVTSIATTARDLNGNEVDLPPPPSSALSDLDFECPYCFVICPAKHAQMRAWRTHVLQDLQPYLCTYPECPNQHEMYETRRAWVEHEALSHRRIWQCQQHPEAVFQSRAGLEAHLHSSHSTDLTDRQIASLADVAEMTEAEIRKDCPICLASIPHSFLKHVANHLERIAAFALPKDARSNEENSGSSLSKSQSNLANKPSIGQMSHVSESISSLHWSSVDSSSTGVVDNPFEIDAIDTVPNRQMHENVGRLSRREEEEHEMARQRLELPEQGIVKPPIEQALKRGAQADEEIEILEQRMELLRRTKSPQRPPIPGYLHWIKPDRRSRVFEVVQRMERPDREGHARANKTPDGISQLVREKLDSRGKTDVELKILRQRMELLEQEYELLGPADTKIGKLRQRMIALDQKWLGQTRNTSNMMNRPIERSNQADEELKTLKQRVRTLRQTMDQERKTIADEWRVRKELEMIERRTEILERERQRQVDEMFDKRIKQRREQSLKRTTQAQSSGDGLPESLWSAIEERRMVCIEWEYEWALAENGRMCPRCRSENTKILRRYDDSGFEGYSRGYSSTDEEDQRPKGRNMALDANVPPLRPVPCILSPYGCSSSFYNKNEWKRHISSQHLQLGFWRCDLCSSVDHSDFNRKDLFLQHLRRMHLDALVRQTSNSEANSSMHVPILQETDRDTEKEIMKRCAYILRVPPVASRCFFCSRTFEGPGSLEENIEHLAKHFETGRKEGQKPVPVHEWNRDETLEDWLIEEDMVRKTTEGGWEIGDGSRKSLGIESFPKLIHEASVAKTPPPPPRLPRFPPDDQRDALSRSIIPEDGLFQEERPMPPPPSSALPSRGHGNIVDLRLNGYLYSEADI